MKTKTLFQIAKGVLIVMLSAFLFFKKSEAQTRYSNQRDHLGFTASFGIRSSKLSSNYTAIDKMALLEEGGSVGLIWGSKALETKLNFGLYYSSSKVPHTTDLIEIEANADFYPMTLITKRIHLVEPYFIGGISKNYYKLHGYYIGEQPGGVNRSVDIEPYLGSLGIYLFSVGSGVAVNLGDKYQFIKLFADAKYSRPFASKKSAVFTETNMSNQIAFNVGIAFGMNRLK